MFAAEEYGLWTDSWHKWLRRPASGDLNQPNHEKTDGSPKNKRRDRAKAKIEPRRARRGPRCGDEGPKWGQELANMGLRWIKKVPR